jgi:hypothetical protein
MQYPNVLRRYWPTLLDLFAWWCLIYAISRVPSVLSMRFGVCAVCTIVSALRALAYNVCLYVEASDHANSCKDKGRVAARRAGSGLWRMIVKYLLGIISFLTVPARA